MNRLFVLLMLIFTSAWGQTPSLANGKKSDLELVKSFGKALEATPGFLSSSKKFVALNQIWTRRGGARDQLLVALQSGSKESFDHMILYNAQKDLSSFLIEAFDTHNTAWMRDMASLYMIPLKYLTESKSITFAYPVLKTGEPTREEILLKRNFKIWVSPESSIKNKNGIPYKSENLISSSQFLYAVSVIIHYAIKNNLDREDVFKDFIDRYYPIAMNDHYLRWVLNRDIPMGTFQTKGWGCNSGTFSHREHVSNLMNNDYGAAEKFKAIGEGKLNVKNVRYCNMYQDRDGWIALGLAHLLVAHQIKPERVQLDPKDEDELKDYLQLSINLFNKRSGLEYFKTPEGRVVETMVFDKGGNYGDSDLSYSGYVEETYPGWSDKAGEGDLTKRISRVPKPPIPPKVSWDMSHGRRFVNFYWSFDKIIDELHLDFSMEGEFRSLEQSRIAFANNLFYKTVKLKDEKKGYNVGNVEFTNYLCGNNGWYRVNYGDKAGVGDPPSSLGKAALTGGQGYFIKYNKSLYSPLKSLYDYQIKRGVPFSNDIFEEINSKASMPEQVFEKVESF